MTAAITYGLDGRPVIPDPEHTAPCPPGTHQFTHVGTAVSRGVRRQLRACLLCGKRTSRRMRPPKGQAVLIVSMEAASIDFLGYSPPKKAHDPDPSRGEAPAVSYCVCHDPDPPPSHKLLHRPTPSPVRCDLCGRPTDGGGSVVPSLDGKPLSLLCRPCSRSTSPANGSPGGEPATEAPGPSPPRPGDANPGVETGASGPPSSEPTGVRPPERVISAEAISRAARILRGPP